MDQSRHVDEFDNRGHFHQFFLRGFLRIPPTAKDQNGADPLAAVIEAVTDQLPDLRLESADLIPHESGEFSQMGLNHLGNRVESDVTGLFPISPLRGYDHRSRM